jgi:hypothetical protein
MAPAWLPDWKNQSLYTLPNSATRLDWAWQFLRRNPEYQRLWKKLRANKPVQVQASAQRAMRHAPFQRVGRRPRPYLYETRVFIEQFGIATVPPDPAQPKANLRFVKQFIRFAQKPSDWPTARGSYEVSTVLDEDQLLVWFDLGEFTDPQLRNTKRLLKGRASRINRFYFAPKNYPIYLRLLDAKEAQASQRQIASTLYPRVGNVHPYFYGNRRVRKDLKIAERLRDRDFWRIAAGSN